MMAKRIFLVSAAENALDKAHQQKAQLNAFSIRRYLLLTSLVLLLFHALSLKQLLMLHKLKFFSRLEDKKNRVCKIMVSVVEKQLPVLIWVAKIPSWIETILKRIYSSSYNFWWSQYYLAKKSWLLYLQRQPAGLFIFQIFFGNVSLYKRHFFIVLG